MTRGQFQHGNRPWSWKPVGTERVSSDGTLQRKVSDTGKRSVDWQSVQSIVYREHHGEIPKGHIVIFRDGNNRNFSRDNLEAITRAEWIRRNRIDRYGKEYKSAAITLGLFKKKLEKMQ